MRKNTRNGFLGLIALGIAMCVAGTLMGGKWAVYFDRGRPHPLVKAPKTLSVTEPLAFDKLDVRLSMGDVRVVSGDAFQIDAVMDDGQTPGYALEGGTLKVFDDGATKFTAGIDLRAVKPGNRATITLPRGQALTALHAESSMGSVTIQDITTADLTANSGMGSVDVSGVLSGASEVSSAMGNACVDAKVTGSLRLFSRMGDARASGELSANCEISADMGSVTVDTRLPRASYTLITRAGMGSVRGAPDAPNLPGAIHTLSASSDMGDVHLRFGE